MYISFARVFQDRQGSRASCCIRPEKKEGSLAERQQTIKSMCYVNVEINIGVEITTTPYMMSYAQSAY